MGHTWVVRGCCCGWSAWGACHRWGGHAPLCLSLCVQDPHHYTSGVVCCAVPWPSVLPTNCGIRGAILKTPSPPPLWLLEAPVRYRGLVPTPPPPPRPRDTCVDALAGGAPHQRVNIKTHQLQNARTTGHATHHRRAALGDPEPPVCHMSHILPHRVWWGAPPAAWSNLIVLEPKRGSFWGGGAQGHKTIPPPHL